jgi:hypothetical protein
VVAAVAMLAPAMPAAAQERQAEHQRLMEILEQLEHGIVALEKLGRHEELEMLHRVANDVRRKIDRRAPAERRRGDRELEIVERQIDALELALPALREGERIDAVEMVERAIHARVMMLEGRRDREAREIRQRSPGRGEILELLGASIELYQELGMPERAEQLAAMTKELWPRRERPQRRGRADRNREAVIHEIEVMRMALPALLEEGRRDTAELLERAVHAREVTLEGRTDEEAHEIRERSPRLGQQVEILQYAAKLWEKFGHEEKAAAIRELAERMWAKRPREHEGREASLERRIDALQEQLTGLMQTLDALREDLQTGGGQSR